jgi:hypothetical protein
MRGPLSLRTTKVARRKTGKKQSTHKTFLACLSGPPMKSFLRYPIYESDAPSSDGSYSHYSSATGLSAESAPEKTDSLSSLIG